MDVFVVEALRTPFGRRDGALGNWHPVDLFSELLVALAERTRIDGTSLHVGCATPVGEQAANVARAAALAAGWSENVAAVSIDGGIASGHLAVHAAIAAVGAGVVDVAVGGGVESCSRIPPGAATGPGIGKPFGTRVHGRYAERGGLLQPGMVAERIAELRGFSREMLDSYAHQSVEQAIAGAASGVTKSEIVPVTKRNDKGNEMFDSIDVDELLVAELSRYKPAFSVDGVVTAGNFPHPGDGAAALMLANAAWCDRLGVDPIARVVSVASAGSDPIDGDSGYGVAVAAMKRAGMKLSKMERIEIQEDSASGVLAFCQDAKRPSGSVNLDGGALAMGEPAGASGAQTVGHLVAAIDSGAAKNGIAVSAGSSPMAVATVLEAVR